MSLIEKISCGVEDTISISEGIEQIPKHHYDLENRSITITGATKHLFSGKVVSYEVKDYTTILTVTDLPLFGKLTDCYIVIDGKAMTILSNSEGKVIVSGTKHKIGMMPEYKIVRIISYINFEEGSVIDGCANLTLKNVILTGSCRFKNSTVTLINSYSYLANSIRSCSVVVVNTCLNNSRTDIKDSVLNMNNVYMLNTLLQKSRTKSCVKNSHCNRSEIRTVNTKIRLKHSVAVLNISRLTRLDLCKCKTNITHSSDSLVARTDCLDI